MSTEKIVASLLALLYVEFMSEIFRLEAKGVKLTPIKISECYRVAVLKAADQFNAAQSSKSDQVMALAMSLQAQRNQSVNDLIEKALKKESEG